MLLRQDARRKRRLVVFVEYRYGSLDDDRSVIQIGCHEVYGAAMNPDPLGQRAAVRVQAGKGRQQRGVNIDQSPS
jgi:hypothetical protein